MFPLGSNGNVSILFEGSPDYLRWKEFADKLAMNIIEFCTRLEDRRVTLLTVYVWYRPESRVVDSVQRHGLDRYVLGHTGTRNRLMVLK